MTFTKKDTLAIKGIAIIMMLMHHNFLNVEQFKGYTINFKPFSQQSVINMSQFFSICVGIFVFISGYGLTLSLKKIDNNYNLNSYQIEKYLINRLLSLYSGYWFVVILSNIICQIIDGRTAKIYFENGYLEGMFALITNFFGLSRLCNLEQLNGTWWYMSLAIVIVLLIPLLIKIYKIYGILFSVLIIIVIPRIANVKDNAMVAWLFTVLLGGLFAEFDILVRLKKLALHINKVINKIYKFIIITTILVLLYKLSKILPYEIKNGIIPALVIYYFYEFIIDVKYLRQILIYLGKHSMNIFFIHTFFRSMYLHEFIYSFKYFMFINIALIIISLVASNLIEVLKKVIKYDCFIDYLKIIINKKLDLIYNKQVINV